ncbi:helix-turn-helix domain-containing protein [Streptomyces sp. NBC_00554]|uniref:helix-turn-helix domain-containing protein n=1 Tax=Streptomyces sp. NBC_00554 TaxID=2903661 RepID=UPI00352C3B27|nr:helix-turn-helix domain-containing protein [Streptomyces sp. NBC_00554]
MTSYSDIAAERIREIRRKRGLTASQLAQRCADIGAPEITTQSVSNIETGRRDKEGRRRRFVTVDELIALAVALGVAPVHLLSKPLPPEELPLPGAWKGSPDAEGLALIWRNYIKGQQALPGMNARDYMTEAPEEEFERLAFQLAKERQRAQEGESDG